MDGPRGRADGYEFLILETLAQRPGVVKSRNQLLDVAYNDDVYVDDRTIDSHIKRIRRKFRLVDEAFDAIDTLYGSDTVSTSNDDGELTLKWSQRWTLAHRILVLNLLTVLLVALGTLYLDVFRNSLSTERVRQTRIAATTTAEAMAHMPRKEWPTLLCGHNALKPEPASPFTVRRKPADRQLATDRPNLRTARPEDTQLVPERCPGT